MSRVERTALWLGACASAVVVVAAVLSAGAWVSGTAETTFTRAVRKVIDESFEPASFESATATTPYHWTWNQGDDPVQMIPVSEGICYLVQVQGAFEGAWESVKVVATRGNWYLEGVPVPSGHPVRPEHRIKATALCWRFPTDLRVPSTTK